MNKSQKEKINNLYYMKPVTNVSIDEEKEEKKKIKEREKRIKERKKKQVNEEEKFDLDTETVIGMTKKNHERDKNIEKKIVDKINAQNPDLVLLAGDIFDNEYEAIEKPEKMAKTLSEIKSRYGTYACWGNHDLPEQLLAGFTVGDKDYDKDERFYKFLEDSDIKLLEDESLLIDGDFYLIGREDASMSKKLGETRETPEQLTSDMDKSKPILVIDHQPGELQELAKAGVDVDFSGHTHNGQIFPGNLLTALSWENPAGVKKIENMYSCVTQGAGVWGPAMRLGTDSEIMVINIEFEKEAV